MEELSDRISTLEDTVAEAVLDIASLQSREAPMRDIRARQLQHYAGWAMLGLVQRPHLNAQDVASLAVDMAEALIAELEARGQ